MSAKFRRAIRVKKFYADKVKNRSQNNLYGRFSRKNLFDFYEKSNKFRAEEAYETVAFRKILDDFHI